MAHKTLRIFFTFDAFNVGGTEIHVLSLAKRLIKQGHHITVCAAYGPLYKEFRACGCDVHIVPYYSTLSGKSARQKVVNQVRRILQKSRIDIVHVHQMISGKLVIAAAQKMNIPAVMTVHGLYYSRSGLTKLASNGVDMIAVSPPLQAWLQKGNIPSTLIPNGISLSRFRSNLEARGRMRIKRGISEDSKVVVYAGRLSIDKAHVCNHVIDAFMRVRSNIPTAKLVIVGTGSYAPSVKRYAKSASRRYKQSGIMFAGLSRSMRDIYAMADCVVGTGRIALEALACEQPVIAIGAQGYFGKLEPSRLEKGWYHFFGDHQRVQTWNDKKLAEDIIHVLHSSELSSTWGKAGRRFVRKRFDVAHVTQQVFERYTIVRQGRE